MVGKDHKIYSLIILAGVILISSKPVLLSLSGQARNPGQLCFDILQTPAKTGDNQLISAGIIENEFQVNGYLQESPDFDGLAGSICHIGFNKKYRLNIYLPASILLLRNLVISELDLPPPLIF
jgi:hypothetical protein